MILRTDAFVLRSMKYGETSRIVTLFTREKGKIAVIAKGARLTKSRFGATLEPMAHIQAVFYYKPTRTLHTLSETAHLSRFPQVRADLDHLALGFRMIELVYALLPEEEPSAPTFNLLLTILSALDRAESNAANLLPYFQLQLARILGFAPAIDRVAVEAIPEEGGVLALNTGAVGPADLAQPTTLRRASRTALRAFATCARASLSAVLHTRIPPDALRELDRLVTDFMQYHVQEAYPVRSSRVLDQILPSSAT